MKKIHRTYGFYDCNLYYSDIDFFNKVIPSEYKPTEFLEMYHICGSAIQLHKDCQGLNHILMSIDILKDEKLLDATPYFEAMAKLLPGVKYKRWKSIELNKVEEELIANQSKNAEFKVDKCRKFLQEKLPRKIVQNPDKPKYSCAQILKECAKGTGFRYEKNEPYVYRLNKNTLKNHALIIEAFAGPSHYSVEFEILFRGVGFEHSLGCCICAPKSNDELKETVKRLLETTKELEEGPLIELDEHYQQGIYYEWK